MNRRDLCLAGVLLVLHSVVFAYAQPAAAHTDLYGSVIWANDLNVEYQFDPSVPTAARAAINAGADAWSAVGRNMRFTQVTNMALQPYASACSTAQHQNNGVFWRDLPSPQAGVVTSCYRDGRLLRAQVAFDSGTPWYTGLGETPYAHFDLAAVSAHEFGHATGALGANGGHFDGNDTSLCPEAPDRRSHTMCPYTQMQYSAERSLEPHDIHSFHGAYGGETFCNQVVYGGIRTGYVALGGPSGPLGCPTGTESDMPTLYVEWDVRRGGRAQRFTNGSMHHHPATGSHGVWGHIDVKYRATGESDGALGFPVTSENATPDGTGFYNHFRNLEYGGTCGQNANGSIYWTPENGTRMITSTLRAKWCALGWEAGSLGYPATDQGSASGGGIYQHFKKPGAGTTCGTNTSGSIYWHPETNAHAVWGQIRRKWCALGWEKGVLGYPDTDEARTPDGTGYFNHFRNTAASANCGLNSNGSIYHSRTGTFEVHGGMRAKWCSMGWEKSALKYPTTDEMPATGTVANPSGRVQWFEGGRMYSTESTGTHVVWGAILTRFVADGGASRYGFPVTDEFVPATDSTARQSDFELASIRWTPAGGTVVCVPRCP